MVFNVSYLESEHGVFSFLFFCLFANVDLYLITLGLLIEACSFEKRFCGVV